MISYRNPNYKLKNLVPGTPGLAYHVGNSGQGARGQDVLHSRVSPSHAIPTCQAPVGTEFATSAQGKDPAGEALGARGRVCGSKFCAWYVTSAQGLSRTPCWWSRSGYFQRQLPAVVSSPRLRQGLGATSLLGPGPQPGGRVGRRDEVIPLSSQDKGDDRVKELDSLKSDQLRTIQLNVCKSKEVEEAVEIVHSSLEDPEKGKRYLGAGV